MNAQANFFEAANKAAGAGPLEADVYRVAHAGLVLACHDVVCLGVDGRIYLVNRGEEPAKGLLWLPGGRIRRGMDTAASAALKVREEIGYDVAGRPTLIGVARTGLVGDPFGHRQGTDSLNLVYAVKLAQGLGEIVRDPDRPGHSRRVPPPADDQGDAAMDRTELRIRAVSRQEWEERVEATVHPYVAVAIRWARGGGMLW